MPNQTNHLLPGQQGRDYHFVKYGGQVYVVYAISLPHSKKTVRLSYAISKDEYKAYGIDDAKVQGISKGAFRSLNKLGNASEIIINGTDHPWVQYLRQLQQFNGNASWLQNKEFLQTMLEGFFEGWDQGTLQQALSQTKWYNDRTATQRAWVQMADADKKASIKGMRSQLDEQLRTLYGPDFDLKKDAGITDKDLDRAATKIARGDFGTADEGVSLWLQRQRDKAEQIEGTPAWIDREQQIEQQNAFMNRPEDVLKQLQDQSFQWLGPQGQPDKDTLTRFASQLVAGTKSQADWENFLQKRASSLYPYLGNGETWQDRASSYKNIIEQNLGTPVAWEDQLLTKIGQTDDNGTPTGQAASFDDFIKQVRQDDRFWTGPVASQETNQLFNRINQTFNGGGVAA